MNLFRERRLLLLLVMTVSLLGGAWGSPASAQVACEPSAGGSTPATEATPAPVPEEIAFPEDGGDLTVFAAASLVDAFAEIETDLENQNPNFNITVETAGSQTLVTQLTEGAAADVLATANISTMEDASEGGLISDEPVLFTANTLVIVAPEDNPADISSVDDLASDDVKLVIAGEDVPVGTYSRNVLCDYAASGNAPDGFIDAVSGNVVSEEVDVRSVLAKVQLGEADAGLVYASDAAASALAGTPLIVIQFPDTLDIAAVYPIAPVTGGNEELAQAFISYVLSADGQATLESYGFVLP